MIDLENSNAWKIQLTIAINIFSSKDGKEEHVMHASSDNVKFKPYSDASNVIDKLFKSLRSKFQVNLITSMRGSDFIFDSVQLMYYKCHRVKFIAEGLHIVSSYGIKKKKSNNKSKNTDNKIF